MRVGLDARALTSPSPTGVERYVVELVRALARLDDCPQVIAYTDRPVADANVLAGAVRVQVLRARRGWLRLALPWRLWRDRFDLVHLPSTIVPPLLPCPAVVTVHDLAFRHCPETYAPDDLAMQFRALRGATRAAHVIAVSQSTARDLMEATGLAQDRITVIPLGVSSAFRPDGPALSLDAFPGADRVRGGCLLHTGGLHPRKNLPRLLDAYADVRKTMSIPPLIIAGDVTTRWGREVVAETAERALTDDVIFPGHVGDAVLPALCRAATVALYPSLYEGFGLPILEAMASGTPVITSNRSSMAEVAGDAAVLVNPESVEGLAGALRRVLSDEQLRHELRARGLARSRQFTWERTARETVAVYRRFARAS